MQPRLTLVLLLLAPKCWDYEYVPPHGLLFWFVSFETRDLLCSSGFPEPLSNQSASASLNAVVIGICHHTGVGFCLFYCMIQDVLEVTM